MSKIEYQRVRLGMLGLATLPALMLSCNGKEERQKPLNIVYIMSDDHAYQMISAYDQRYIQTPNIDRLANEGVRFTESFVANSISGPSRACMLTGKHSHMNGKINNARGNEFDQNQLTMPKVLHEAGYQTAMIGKLHLDGIPQGFDHWCILPGQGDYYDPKFLVPRGNPLDGSGKVDTITREGYVTRIITDMSLNWLDHREKDKPFALFIHHKAAHRNWMADTTDLMVYEDVVFPMPDTYYDTYQGRQAAALQEMEITRDMDMVYDLKMLKGRTKDTGYTPFYTREDDTKGIHGSLRPEIKSKFDALYDPISEDFYAKKWDKESLSDFKYQRYMRDYAKVIRSLDREIGRVYDYLKEHDLLENTLVVYTSDQGFYMGEHGWFDKRFMYEESMRTPLVMRLPEGYKRRGDVDDLVQNIDYAPTFIDMAGVAIPEEMQGVSLKEILRDGNSKLERKGLYYHFYEYPGEHAVRRHYGIRDKRYKLIHFYGDIDAWELYDLQKDPKELNNLYGKPEYELLTDSLKTELRLLEEQYKAVDVR